MGKLGSPFSKATTTWQPTEKVTPLPPELQTGAQEPLRPAEGTDTSTRPVPVASFLEVTTPRYTPPNAMVASSLGQCSILGGRIASLRSAAVSMVKIECRRIDTYPKRGHWARRSSQEADPLKHLSRAHWLPLHRFLNGGTIKEQLLLCQILFCTPSLPLGRLAIE